MPLSFEQFQKARATGLSLEQIIKFDTMSSLATGQRDPGMLQQQQDVGAQQMMNQQRVQHPYSSAIATSAKLFGRDVGVMGAHFGNQLLLNWPRSITEKMGGTYPTQAATPMGQTLAYGAGVLGGWKNPLIRAAGSVLKGGGLLQGMASGGLASAAYAPERLDSPQQVGQEALMKGLVGMALPVAGKGIGMATGAVGKALGQMPGRMLNSMIGAKPRQMRFANPGEGMAREGFIDNSLEAIGKKVEERLKILDNNLSVSYKNKGHKVADFDKPISYIYDVKAELAKNPQTNAAALNRVDAIISDLTGTSTKNPRNFKKLNPEQARKLKQDVSEFIDWGLVGKADKKINRALKQVYHAIDETVDHLVPESKELNKRVSDLIAAKESITSKIDAMKTRDVLPGNIFQAANIPFKALQHPALKTRLASMLTKKYPKPRMMKAHPLTKPPFKKVGNQHKIF